MTASARSMPFSCRRRALELSTALRPLLLFLVTPPAWCAASTAGRWFVDSAGSWTCLRDLSVSMLGEVARLAAREWSEGAEEGETRHC